MDRSDTGVGISGTANTDSHAASSVKARSGGRRRSCNRCSSKKERCDGQEPCHRCMRSGLDCLYATCRTLGRPRNSTPPGKRRMQPTPPTGKASSSSSSAASIGAPATNTSASTGTSKKTTSKGGASTLTKTGSSAQSASSPGEPVVVESQATTATQRKGKPRKPNVRGPTSTTPTAPALLPLKRPYLSPSPATGLVGMVQNRWLTCFLEDFSSLYSVLDDVTIRTGLINLMTGKVDVNTVRNSMTSTTPLASPSAKHTVPRGGSANDILFPRNDGASSALTKAVSPSTRGGLMSLSFSLPSTFDCDEYAINSSIFSAMALGALMLGQQPADVEQYSAVAEVSLRLCGALDVAVSNERVAVAQLLLAFTLHFAGHSDYVRRIGLVRDCLERLERQGGRCPPIVRDVLNYRNIIDSLSKSSTTRVPQLRDVDSAQTAASSDHPVARIPSTTDPPSPTVPSSPVERSPGGIDDGVPSSSSDGQAGNRRMGEQPGGGSWKSVSGTDVKLSPLSRPGVNPGERASAQRANGEKSKQFPPGLEAARERSRRRQADPVFMISDIMTVLSKTPWSLETGDGARRSREQMVELRNLLMEEKSLLEERRVAARTRKDSTASDSLAVFALASAFIGLHCALEEFEEMLSHARDIARSIVKCPGLARYQLHGFHTALAVLRAFGRRKEFDDLVRVGVKEIGRGISDRPIKFDSNGVWCSRQVCVNHCRAIRDMKKRHMSDASAANSNVHAPAGQASSAVPLFASARTLSAAGSASRRARRSTGPMVATNSVQMTTVEGMEVSPIGGGAVTAATRKDRRGSCTPEKGSLPSLERRGSGEGDAEPRHAAQGSAEFGPGDFRTLDVKSGRLIPNVLQSGGGGQWTASSAHKKRSLLLSWGASPQSPTVVVTSSSSGAMGTEITPPGSLSPLPSFSSTGEIGVVNSPVEGGRILRQVPAPLPPYPRFWPLSGGSTGGGLSPMGQSASTTGDRQITPFPEVLRQAQASMTRLEHDWEASRGLASATERRFGGGMSIGSKAGSGGSGGSAGEGVDSPARTAAGGGASFLLPSIRLDDTTSSVTLEESSPRSGDVRALSSPSMSHMRGEAPGSGSGNRSRTATGDGANEGYLDEPYRDHYPEGPSSVRGSSDASQHTGGLQQPSLPAQAAAVPTEGQLLGAGQIPPSVAFGAGAAGAARSSDCTNTTVGEPEEMPSPPLWDTGTSSPRGPTTNSAASTRGGFSQSAPPHSQPREGVQSLWQWGSSPQLISSPATSPSSAVPTPSMQYGPMSSGSQFLAHASVPLATAISATPLSATAYQAPRSSEMISIWRSSESRLLSAATGATSACQAEASTSVTSVVAAVSPSYSSPSAPMAPTVAATLSTPSAAGPARGNTRVSAGVDGTGGQDDNMLIDWWSLMDNGDAQEGAQ